MTRTEARELMMQTYFQMEACEDFNIDQRDVYMNEIEIKSQQSYCKEMYSLICNKKEAVDGEIDKYSRGWTCQRMPKTDLAVLRLAACEILFVPDIPNAVSINEAVELAKKFGTNDSGSYVNAILGRIASTEKK